MNNHYARLIVGTVLLFGACAAETTESEDHAAEASTSEVDHNHDAPSTKHAPYGHASAQYVCNGRELFTRYSKTETVLSYDGVEINITRFPTEEGAVFSGSLDGVSVRFNGKHHSETLQLGDDIFACEKITCIPLDAPI